MLNDAIWSHDSELESTAVGQMPKKMNVWLDIFGVEKLTKLKELFDILILCLYFIENKKIYFITHIL